MYQRVLPRDLFNEAKLLKCIGRLVLSIHDGMGVNGMQFEHDGSHFQIELQSDGSLFIYNIRFSINGKLLFFKTIYNSKANYPLYLDYENVDYEVFNEDGEYTEEFINLCNQSEFTHPNKIVKK